MFCRPLPLAAPRHAGVLNGLARLEEPAPPATILREAAPRQGKLPRIAKLPLAHQLHKTAALMLSLCTVVLSIFLENSAISAEKPSVPNIVLILIDDKHWQAATTLVLRPGNRLELQDIRGLIGRNSDCGSLP